MRSGEQKVARDYVLYREEHARLRGDKAEPAEILITQQFE